MLFRNVYIGSADNKTLSEMHILLVLLAWQTERLAYQ